MEDDKIRAVVVGGWIHDNKEQMIQLIGVYESPIEAYGAAYLYLDEMAAGYSGAEKDYSITLPQNLEGDTGYGLYLKSKEGQIADYAYVLFNEETWQEKEG